MRRLFENKAFVIALITVVLIALIGFSAIPGSPLSGLTKPVSIIIDPIQSVFQKIGTKISDFYSAIAEGMEIRKENEQLRAEIAELEYQVQQGDEARIRWEELKTAFSIQDTFENYHIHGASILTRESDEWFSVIRVNVGTDTGIDVGKASYAVVDARMNLVGRVMSTDVNSSKILPILHEGFMVSAKVNVVNGAIVLVTGDIILKNEGLCLVTRIPSNIVLNPGDELVTSGEGGLFPAGIPIGVIESFDNSDPDNPTATLRPYVEISSIKDVFIMVQNTEEWLAENEKQQQSESAGEESSEDIPNDSIVTEPNLTDNTASESGEESA